MLDSHVERVLRLFEDFYFLFACETLIDLLRLRWMYCWMHEGGSGVCMYVYEFAG